MSGESGLFYFSHDEIREKQASEELFDWPLSVVRRLGSH